jgi:tetratricopeptide (TPR) repeat protein
LRRHWKKAEILTKLEKSDAEDAYRKAISLAENELVLNPNDVNALMNKANALMDVESFEDASNILLKIAELLPHPEAKKICKNSAALLSTKAYFDKALKEFAKKNFGNAEIDLKEVVQSLGNIDEKDVKAFAKEDVARFLIKIVELKSTEILRIALAILSQAKGFEEFLNTFKLSLDIVKTKDVAKFYDVQVEKREIIADIVERLSGSKDLLPPEYKKIRKDS